MTGFRWEILSDDEEEAEHEEDMRRQRVLWAFRALEVQLCEDERGGHGWYLEVDPDEGVSFGCLHCPATGDDLTPYGGELLYGSFEVTPGYELTLGALGVWVNGRDYGGHAFGWRGPVTATVRTERSGTWDSPEWDTWVELEPVTGL